MPAAIPPPCALILITSDPADSGRPAEGLRLAAGLAPWGQFPTRVFLDDGVVRRWCREPESVKDEAVFREALSLLCEPDGPGIMVPTETASEFPILELPAGNVPVRGASWEDLGRLCAEGAWTMRF